MKWLKRVAITLILSFILYSCKLCYFKDPACLIAPQETTNVKENKFYKKNFIKTDTLLSTEFRYELIDTDNEEIGKYKVRSFLFYDNGLVFEWDGYTNRIKYDTTRAPSKDITKACCHGNSIGSYIVSSDSVHFGVKVGNMENWIYHSAIIYPDRISVFRKTIGKVAKDTSMQFTKNNNEVVLKTLKY